MKFEEVDKFVGIAFDLSALRIHSLQRARLILTASTGIQLNVALRPARKPD